MPMSSILSRLYVGSLSDAGNLELLKQNQICAIISVGCYHELKIPIFVTDYLRIPIQDTMSADISEYFEEMIHFIHRIRQGGRGSVLVHCTAASSRSVAIVIAYLLTIPRATYASAISFIKGRHPFAFPNVGFRMQLQDKSLDEEYSISARNWRIISCTSFSRYLHTEVEDYIEFFGYSAFNASVLDFMVSAYREYENIDFDDIEGTVNTLLKGILSNADLAEFIRKMRSQTSAIRMYDATSSSKASSGYEVELPHEVPSSSFETQLAAIKSPNKSEQANQEMKGECNDVKESLFDDWIYVDDVNADGFFDTS